MVRNKHQLLFQQFSATFQPETIQYWQKMITTWKSDHTQPNPYIEPVSCEPTFFSASNVYSVLYIVTTLQDVRLELAKEDLALAAQGAISPHKTSLTSFLTIGLELEEQQYVQSWLLIIPLI